MEAASEDALYTRIAKIVHQQDEPCPQIEAPSIANAPSDPWLVAAGMWSDVPDAQWERFQKSIAAGRQLDEQPITLIEFDDTLQ